MACAGRLPRTCVGLIDVGLAPNEHRELAIEPRLRTMYSARIKAEPPAAQVRLCSIRSEIEFETRVLDIEI